MQGKIVRLMKEKGFGFIRAEEVDYFFHRTALKNIRFDDLVGGEEVEFEDSEASKGPRAEDIYV